MKSVDSLAIAIGMSKAALWSQAGRVLGLGLQGLSLYHGAKGSYHGARNIGEGVSSIGAGDVGEGLSQTAGGALSAGLAAAPILTGSSMSGLLARGALGSQRMGRFSNWMERMGKAPGAKGYIPTALSIGMMGASMVGDQLLGSLAQKLIAKKKKKKAIAARYHPVYSNLPEGGFTHAD